MNKSICLVIALAVLAVGRVVRADDIAITNTLNRPVYLWIWHDRDGHYENPIYMGRGYRARIDLSCPGAYYLTITDEHDRELPIGRDDLHLEKILHPSGELWLDVVYASRGKKVTRHVNGMAIKTWVPIGESFPVSVTLMVVDRR